MGVFHVFRIVLMLQNRAMHLCEVLIVFSTLVKIGLAILPHA